jgi:hypothetical protein
MKTAVLSLTLFFVSFGVVPKIEAQRLSTNDRRAVVLEAFYALRPSHDGSCDKTIAGDCISNWNFIDSNASAYAVMKSWYGCNASDWSVHGDACFSAGDTTAASFYSNVASYGYGTFGGWYGAVGRGGQCTFFTNLVLYRSGSHTSSFPSLSTMWADTETNLQKTVEGDVLQVYGVRNYENHVAIVVQVYRTGTIVTGLDVIDANFITDIAGMANREVIARHLLPVSSAQGVYRIWKGTRYYDEPYNPNE